MRSFTFDKQGQEVRLEDLPTDPPQVLSGRQVSQGLELSASGAITSSWVLLRA